MGDSASADRILPPARQAPTPAPASHGNGDSLAAHERSQVACHPARLGTVVDAARTFIRWARLGVWERVLDLAQQRGVALGMTFLDGTTIRAHPKAAGASKKGDLRPA